MSNGSTTIGKSMVKSVDWQTMYMKQQKESAANETGGIYMLGSGLVLGERVEARLVKAWQTRDSQGTMAFHWADRCSSLNGITPAPYVRNPPSKECCDCIRRSQSKGNTNPCREVYTLGLQLKEPALLVLFRGVKSARKPVDRLIQAIASLGEVDLLEHEIMLHLGSERKTVGGNEYDQPQIAYSIIENVQVDEHTAKSIFEYELTIYKEEEESTDSF